MCEQHIKTRHFQTLLILTMSIILGQNIVKLQHVVMFSFSVDLDQSESVIFLGLIVHKPL